jgi:hypothetical protein
MHMMKTRRALGAVLAVVVLLSASACTASDSSTAASRSSSPAPSPSASSGSGVSGTVVVYLMGGESPQPGVTVTVYAGTTQNEVVAKSKTDTHGAFSFDLPPGTYTLVWRYGSPETVTVSPGQYVTTKLSAAGK